MDLTIDLARWLGWTTLGAVALMVAGLLVLRWVRWRRAPHLAAFEARWLPLLMGCALGAETGAALPPLTRAQRWPFMKLWLHCQMSLHGPSRQRLAALGRKMGCHAMALQRARSMHESERMVGMLALGFLHDSDSVGLLQRQLAQAGARQSVYASRALLELDAQAHADAVVRALLDIPELEVSLASVMLKPFRAVLAEALLRHTPQVDDPRALGWLRLARALRLQMPGQVLAPFLQPQQDIEVLIAAIRLVQGEQGAGAVAAHAGHADWRVRAQVARALGFIGGDAELPLLNRMLTDAQWWVRYRSAQSLMRLPGQGKAQLQALANATGDRYAISMAQAVVAQSTHGPASVPARPAGAA